jgi:hypothetical protein
MSRWAGIAAAILLRAISPAVDPPAPVAPVPTLQQAAWKQEVQIHFPHWIVSGEG